MYLDDVNSSTAASIMSITSDEDDTESESNSLSEYVYQKTIIPNISKWTKQQVLEYLIKKLPKEIIQQINKYVSYC